MSSFSIYLDLAHTTQARTHTHTHTHTPESLDHSGGPGEAEVYPALRHGQAHRHTVCQACQGRKGNI